MDKGVDEQLTQSSSSRSIRRPSPLLSLLPKLRRALRGDVSARVLLLETGRRTRSLLERKRERSRIRHLKETGARLCGNFALLTATELLAHFRSRSSPKFLPGLSAPLEEIANLQRSLFPAETHRLLETAARIAFEHRWSLLGYEEQCFGEEISWRRDPRSGKEWPLDFHADTDYDRRDGSDIRVLWELNRLAHLLTLARAYAVTSDERLAKEFFSQVESWSAQNPLGFGPNWACAMEVALRSINLLAAFEVFRRSAAMNESRLAFLLALFDQHGTHIRRNLEFSYLTTSNHYLSDVAGLFMLGVMLPELKAADGWRAFGLRELLVEMEKQVLPDGADDEASTGYHRFALELFLYSFLVARANALKVDEKYWMRVRSMLDYMRAYQRPDGRAPLIGDTDGGQALPFVRRAADDHAYILQLGASVFTDSRFKSGADHLAEELLWIMGEEGVRAYRELKPDEYGISSQAFTEAGTYVMREGELYLLFNASGAGLCGRGSHGHNDALSLEVSACGTLFIVDPGTYVYRGNLSERQLFRSTAYHSTVEVDGAEQNTINEELPFVAGDEARPKVLRWESGPQHDLIVAEHYGYQNLAQPVTHRRTVRFDKSAGFWLVEDSLTGAGDHVFRFRFHFTDGMEVSVEDDVIVTAWDRTKGVCLIVAALEAGADVALEPQFVSRNYGSKEPSISACWTLSARANVERRWALVPVCAEEQMEDRLKVVARLRLSPGKD